MELKVTFIYHNNSFQTSCSKKDKVADLLEKFKPKLNELNPKADINDYGYFYQEEELTIEENLDLKPEDIVKKS